VRVFPFRAAGVFSVDGVAHKSPPGVFAGGAAATTGSLTLVTDGGVVDLVSKVPYHKIRAGDRIVAHGPSGGGYGNPLLRDPEAVRGDVLDSHLTEEAARAAYGVVISAGTLDLAATKALRDQRGTAP
jgi:N-methylhydantoinase B